VCKQASASFSLRKEHFILNKKNINNNEPAKFIEETAVAMNEIIQEN
jgi:hypothetical protein